MADVFISYHEKSAGELAEQIADALDNAGISAWCARRDMTLGGNFAREIPNQIHDCRLFLLVLNDNVYHSEHIENEVGIAFSRVNKKENIRILPLELGEFTRKDWVEYYLIHTQSVKFPAQPDEKRLQRLVQQIAKTLIIKHGKCGDNVYYRLDENGVLALSGNGPMWAYSLVPVLPWEDEREIIIYVKIENGVTKISSGAFIYCTNLISVTISDSVTEIGDATFLGCVNLTSVTIPDSVKEIKFRAFAGCTGLTSVTISDNVTKIEKAIFAYCTRLTNVRIPDNVTKIEGEPWGAFYGCTSLRSVSVPASTEIESGAFPDNVRITRRE